MSATAFEQQLAARSAEVCADFLLPHLDRHSHLLDVGCGETNAFSYGTPALVRAFADGRGSECADDDYVAEAVTAGLVTVDELTAMATAWSEWGQSHASYATFAWCRAVARRPTDEEGPR